MRLKFGVSGQSCDDDMSVCCVSDDIRRRSAVHVRSDLARRKPKRKCELLWGANPTCAIVTITSGSANCMVNNLTVAMSDTEDKLNLTARYSGDANNTSSNSTALKVTVLRTTEVVFRGGLETESAFCPIE
jgi:hypothetical protein